MGGQIMPPVMGAVAFIMAETIDVPYVEICKAAIIPALLYFGTAFWIVHLEAGKRRLLGLPADQCPSALAALKRDWYLILPLAALVWLLFSGYTPLFAGTVGLALTAIVVLRARLRRHRPVRPAPRLLGLDRLGRHGVPALRDQRRGAAGAAPGRRLLDDQGGRGPRPVPRQPCRRRPACPPGRRRLRRSAPSSARSPSPAPPRTSRATSSTSAATACS